VEIEHPHNARPAVGRKFGPRSDLSPDLTVASSKHSAGPLAGFLTFSARCALVRHRFLEDMFESQFCWPASTRSRS
jgi:hypothetical protein